jgi:serine phosphatase RsbU (regulator of sigma subunit)
LTDKESVTFNHLPPGHYEFQLKAKNSDGVWSPDPLSYSFSIEPPFWRTTWFYSSSGVLAVLLVLLILRFRTRSLVRQQKQLEKEVAARTRELEKEKERIEEINQDLEGQKAEAERQKDLVESKNKEITDSLRYAKRIQKALLKEEKRVTEHLPPHFVLFKPREHVSGDFYWALEKEDRLFVTVADCTGHGVPGAFMSMLGTAFLNEICAPEGVKSPGTVLQELREKIVKEMTRDSEFEDLKDGMDISMLRIDLRTREVIWSGANNPLVRIIPSTAEGADRLAKSRDGERALKELRPDRKPIGLSEDESRFTEHRFTPEKGEVLYLFSDGFPDQFGGERGKKYKSRNFKQLLLETSSQPLDEQRETLNEEFERWRGNQEQIDDVCVLGISP